MGDANALRVPQLKCPKCANVITTQTGQKPVCNKCGYGGTAKPTTSAPALAAPMGAPATMPTPGRLRPVSIGMTILLSIVTFGIYYLVKIFKVSGDLHRAPGGMSAWKALYWTGVVFGIPMFVLYFFNNKQLNAMGQTRGRKPSYLPFILAVIPFVSIAAPFVWASQFNSVAART